MQLLCINQPQKFKRLKLVLLTAGLGVARSVKQLPVTITSLELFDK